MAFPSISTKATNVELTPEIEGLLDQKFKPLEKFISSDETDVACNVELNKIAEHQSGKIYRVEVNFKIAGRLHRAEATEDQIERAIDVARDELKRELRRAQSKQRSLVRRGGAALKNMLQFGKE